MLTAKKDDTPPLVEQEWFQIFWRVAIVLLVLMIVLIGVKMYTLMRKDKTLVAIARTPSQLLELHAARPENNAVIVVSNPTTTEIPPSTTTTNTQPNPYSTSAAVTVVATDGRVEEEGLV